MRADRLLALLMLLQTRGRLSANTLAFELEVSERTIYRDVEALSMSGVPIYAERGPGGGIQLLDGYRTTLTGLNADEIQALFMLTVPTAVDDLGLTQPFKSAMGKLAAELQSGRRFVGINTRQHVLIDTESGNTKTTAVSYLHTIHQAVQLDHLLDITIELSFGTLLQREVAPYGLVSSAQEWYLVWAGDGRIDTTPLSQVRKVTMLEKQFERPASFDLEEYWREWVTAVAANQPSFVVTASFAPQIQPHLIHLFGTEIYSVSPNSPTEVEGWRIITLTFTSLEEARARLLALGGAVYVLSPAPLRLTLADFARQTLRQYPPS